MSLTKVGQGHWVQKLLGHPQAAGDAGEVHSEVSCNFLVPQSPW